ncbi:MAG: response regulator [Deltaproteobacteria bacterium]|nr:response regulator [Deltaproteobacteria bacterium]
MGKQRKPVTVLIADDDPDDQRLTREALAASEFANDLHFVGDGEELLDYLYGRGKYTDPASAPRPNLILLDLNMPRKDGREVLREIKQDPGLRSIPVIVFSVSQSQEDIACSYDLGANSYMRKPVSFAELIDALQCWSDYWLKTVELASR